MNLNMNTLRFKRLYGTASGESFQDLHEFKRAVYTDLAKYKPENLLEDPGINIKNAILDNSNTEKREYESLIQFNSARGIVTSEDEDAFVRQMQEDKNTKITWEKDTKLSWGKE